MAINFRLAFYYYGRLIIDPRRIARAYLAFPFWMDLVATWPFDMMFDSFMPTRNGDSLLSLLGTNGANCLGFVRDAWIFR
eukprot:scaffold699_cov385-Prasinococcus_capsulatus_cf.AAC.8